MWWELEEPLLHPFIVMQPRIEARRQQQMIDALVIAAGRQVSDKSYQQLVDDLQRQADGKPPVKRRAPKATSLNAIGRDLGMRVIRENTVAAGLYTQRVKGLEPGMSPADARRLKAQQEQAAAEAA